MVRRGCQDPGGGGSAAVGVGHWGLGGLGPWTKLIGGLLMRVGAWGSLAIGGGGGGWQLG